MRSNLIEEFIDKKSFDAMQTLVSTLKDDEAKDSAVQLANVFGAGESFKKIANSEPEAEAQSEERLRRLLQLHKLPTVRTVRRLILSPPGEPLLAQTEQRRQKRLFSF